VVPRLLDRLLIGWFLGLEELAIVDAPQTERAVLATLSLFGGCDSRSQVADCAQVVVEARPRAVLGLAEFSSVCVVKHSIFYPHTVNPDDGYEDLTQFDQLRKLPFQRGLVQEYAE
jgi:hypothetical protein